MNWQALKIGRKYLYDDGGEKCQATVTKIDIDKEVIHFIDWEDFDWEEPFRNIPSTIIRELK